MTNSMKAGVVGGLAGLVVAALIAVGYFYIGKNGGTGGNSGGTGGNGGDGTKEVAKPMPEIKKDPIPVSAVDRVVSRTMRGEFGLVGRGEDAKWGIARTANFKYTVIVVADSEILSKEVLPGGEIKVTEIRTFNKVQDSMVVSDVDMKLALDTLPIKIFSQAIDAAVTLWTSMTGDAASGAAVLTGKNYVMEKLKDIDGTGVRALLGASGVQPAPEMEAAINQIANAHVLKALGGVRAISGKSYKIVYYQKASGQPLYVKFTYSDGTEVTDEEEQMVLKRVNAFIDYNMVPNKECVPGDNWNIQARDMQEVFDSYVEGTYSGIIRATRKSNTPNGDWMIYMSPSNIDVVNDNGNTTGHLNLEKGYALVNPKLVSINEMFVEGTANLQKLSKHHWLFTSRISGECAFQGKVVTTHK